MDVSRLSKLFEAGNSGVKKFTRTLSVVVDISHKDNWSLGAVIFLNSKLQHYFEGFDGVLLGYEDVSVKSSPSDPDPDIDLHHVTIQAKFFVFSPEVGKSLSGKIVAKKKSSVIVAVHDYFQVTCLSPKNLKKLDVGAQVKVKISSVVYVNGRPNMMGEVDKIETSNTLTSPSTSAAVNGVSSPVKRKADAEEKPKKKAKTAAAAAESQEDDIYDATTADNDSDNEEQSPPKTPTPKAPKTPGKTPKKVAEKKPVPEGFNVVEITRPNGRKDKEFVGPDGKKYRSILEIYRKLNLDPESGSGKSSSQEKESVEEMKEQVEYVANSWNKGEDGELAKNKNKFYNSVGLKEICKIDKKGKKGKAGKKVEDKDDAEEAKDDAEEAEEEADQDSAPPVSSPNKASVTIGDTGDVKKKKKKKKNKENDQTI